MLHLLSLHWLNTWGLQSSGPLLSRIPRHLVCPMWDWFRKQLQFSMWSLSWVVEEYCASYFGDSTGYSGHCGLHQIDPLLNQSQEVQRLSLSQDPHKPPPAHRHHPQLQPRLALRDQRNQLHSQAPRWRVFPHHLLRLLPWLRYY